MNDNVAVPRPDGPPLNPKQQHALELLAEGRHTYAEIASLVAVDRTTLHRWRCDPDFSAELSRRQRLLHQQAQARLLSATNKAAANVAAAIEQGDLSASQHHLRHLLPHLVPGPEAEDPQYLRAVAALEETKRQVAAMQQRVEEAGQALFREGFTAMLRELHPDVDGEAYVQRVLPFADLEWRRMVANRHAPHGAPATRPPTAATSPAASPAARAECQREPDQTASPLPPTGEPAAPFRTPENGLEAVVPERALSESSANPRAADGAPEGVTGQRPTTLDSDRLSTNNGALAP